MRRVPHDLESRHRHEPFGGIGEQLRFDIARPVETANAEAVVPPDGVIEQIEQIVLAAGIGCGRHRVSVRNASALTSSEAAEPIVRFEWVQRVARAAFPRLQRNMR